MCDLATEYIVEEVIQEKVRAGEMFTAYDVTCEARRRGATDRHRAIRQFVHDLHARGRMGPDYARSLIHIPDIGATPWLYHCYWDDPAEYRPLPARDLPQTTTRDFDVPPSGISGTLEKLLMDTCLWLRTRRSARNGLGRS
jgi:hypothetical protein